MQDNVVRYIRPLLFSAIVSHIDWDNETLVQRHFASATSSLFRQDDIRFRGQLTQPAYSRPVSLSIPINDDPQELGEAAIALEGLYQFRQYGNWDFDGGTQLLESLGNCLDKWSEHVVGQLKLVNGEGVGWDPSEAAVELLAVGVAMSGASACTPTEWLNALFGEWPEESSGLSNEWKLLYGLVLKEQSKLREIARARTSGTKGGQLGAFINPSKFLPTIQTIIGCWELSQQPPDLLGSRRDEYADLGRLYSKVKAELPIVAKAEWTLNMDWTKEWYQNVPEGLSGQEVVDKVRVLLDMASTNGVGFNIQLKNSVEEALSELETVQLEDALAKATKLRIKEEPLQQLSNLGSDQIGDARSTVKRLLPVMQTLLNQLEAEVSNRIRNIGQDAKDLHGQQSQIKASLSQLSSDLGVIGGPHATMIERMDQLSQDIQLLSNTQVAQGQVERYRTRAEELSNLSQGLMVPTRLVELFRRKTMNFLVPGTEARELRTLIDELIARYEADHESILHPDRTWRYSPGIVWGNWLSRSTTTSVTPGGPI